MATVLLWLGAAPGSLKPAKFAASPIRFEETMTEFHRFVIAESRSRHVSIERYCFPKTLNNTL
jgi:hypothetical protein